jgi:hypothetical protein
MRPVSSGVSGVLAIGLVLAACAGGGTPSIAGTYNCGIEGGDVEDVVELGTDGSFTVTLPDGTVETGGTWRAEGEGGVVVAPTGEEDPFTIEGENLVFADPGAPRFVCTPAD